MQRIPLHRIAAFLSLVCLPALLPAGCAGDNGQISFVLPSQLALEDLPDESLFRLRAVANIPGVLNDAPLDIDLDAGTASGTFSIPNQDVTGATLTVEFFSAHTLTSPEVLIARTVSSISIKRGEDNETKLGKPTTDGDIIFDLNRNGRSNLQDLIDGFDPEPGLPPVDISPETISFAAGVEVGGFTRSFFVVENISDEAVTMALDVQLAPGVTLAPLSQLFDATGALATTHQEILLPAGTEEVFALTFAPANPLFLLGSVAMTTRTALSNVEHGSMMRLLGNPQGAIPQPPPGYLIPTPADGVSIGGYTGAVTAYPLESLFSRAPKLTEVLEADAGGIGTIDLDAAYLVAVPPRHRFSAVFDGLSSDIDVYLFALDENFQPLSDTPIATSAHAGTSGESVSYDATGERHATALLLLGFDGITTPSAEDVPQGQVASQTGGVTQTALFSVPELLQPCARDADGVLLDGTCLEPIVSQTACPTFYDGSLACGQEDSTTAFTLRGQNIQAGAIVRVGQLPAVCTDVESLDTHDEIHCLAPPAAQNAAEQPFSTVVLTNPDGQAATLAEGFTYFPSAPSIFSVLPGAGPNTGGMSATVQGLGFFKKDGNPPQVWVGDASASSVEVLSGSQVRMVIPPCSTCTDGTLVDVRVINPDQQEGTLFTGFEYREPQGPPPTITSLTPSTGPTTGGTSISLSGTNFSDQTTVKVGGGSAAGVVFVDSSTLTFLTPIGVAGLADVEVVNGDGQTARAEDAFEYVVPPPTVASISISSGPEIGGTSVFVGGSFFRSGAQVYFGGVLASEQVVLSSTLITCRTPAGSGTVDVEVRNVDGRAGVLSNAFQYLAPTGTPPTVSSVSPSSGTTAGGTQVTILGTDFEDGARVYFGVASAAAVSFLSSTELRVMSPAANEGVVNLRLVNPNGHQVDVPAAYTYVTPPPQVSTVIPLQGPESGGTVIQVLGQDFDPLATASIGGSPCLDPALTGSTVIRCTTPPGTGTANITVTNGDGQSGTLPSAFQYNVVVDPPPLISGLSPNSGSSQGGTAVDIAGQDFDVDGATVSFGGNDAVVNRSGSTPTLLRVSTPPGIAGAAVSVLVQNSDGQSSLSSFTYTSEPQEPAATSLLPASSDAYENTAVFVVGQGFTSGASIRVEEHDAAGGTLTWSQNATGTVLISEQLLSTTLPAYASSNPQYIPDGSGGYSARVSLVVTLSSGLELRLENAFTYKKVAGCVPSDPYACGSNPSSCLCDGPQCLCDNLCPEGAGEGTSCGCGGYCNAGVCYDAAMNCNAGETCQAGVCVDACGNTCAVDEYCVVMPSPQCVATSSFVCDNDGVRDFPEVCDGDDLGGVTCLHLGYSQGRLTCAGDCTFDTSGCVPSPGCGNGTVENSEACDPGSFSPQACTLWGYPGSSGTVGCSDGCLYDFTACNDSAAGVFLGCGNGVLDPLGLSSDIYEECDGQYFGGAVGCGDFGLGSGSLSCSDQCSLVTSGCTGSVCGNGRLDQVYSMSGGQSMELCDGTLFVSGITCERFGYVGGSLGCDSSCNLDFSGCTVPAASCEDGTQNGDESDLDCGGSCAPCAASFMCTASTDCLSGVCDVGGTNTCMEPSCLDGIQNGEESDVDCGGECGNGCPVGGGCYQDWDCASVDGTICESGICGQLACATDSDCPYGTHCDQSDITFKCVADYDGGTGGGGGEGSYCDTDYDCNGGLYCQQYSCVGGCTAGSCDVGYECMNNRCVDCFPGNYLCPSSDYCVSATYVCDGFSDCPFGEDESTEMCDLCSTVSENFICNNMCIESSFACDGFDDCGTGEDESPELCGCPSGTFDCYDGTCLAGSKVCDGFSDCGGGSDEANCVGSTCGDAGDFYCSWDGDCVNDTQVCDGTPDCGDSADEAQCGCGPGLFSCTDGSGCVDGIQLCAGTYCLDSSDSDVCAATPTGCGTTNRFVCSDLASCINEFNVCDGTPDCGDGSDETLELCGCPPDQWMCADKSACVAGTVLCDASQDCSDNSDETLGTCPSGCVAGDFVCRDGSQCLSPSQQCDSAYDCADGSDESPRFCGCPAGQFRCSDDSACVDGSFVCDGTQDCADNSDENHGCAIGCGGGNSWVCHDNQSCVDIGAACDGNTFECMDGSDEHPMACAWSVTGMYNCGNGFVIPASLFCDGNTFDCGDIDEEAVCGVPPTGCDVATNTFLCADGSACLDPSLLCDATSDCGDNSDEDATFCAVGHCFDGAMNLGETQVDCGGICPPCP